MYSDYYGRYYNDRSYGRRGRYDDYYYRDRRNGRYDRDCYTGNCRSWTDDYYRSNRLGRYGTNGYGSYYDRGYGGYDDYYGGYERSYWNRDNGYDDYDRGYGGYRRPYGYRRRGGDYRMMLSEPSSNDQKKLVILGSLNWDVFLKMNELPDVGEEVAATDDVLKAFNGKGANMAIAASRLLKDKYNVQMLGQLGGDSESAAIVKFLQSQEVDVSRLIDSEFMLRESGAGNQIAVVGGIPMEDLSYNWKCAIADADILVLQGDMPLATNILAAKYAQANGVKVMLDMGSQVEVFDSELMENVNIIMPTQLPDGKVTDLLQKYPGMDMLKKDAEGASYFSNKDESHMDLEMEKKVDAQDTVKQPAYKFADFAGRAEHVDSAGADDCFMAAFAVAQLEGSDVKTSLELANKSAFLCMQRPGVAMPSREEVESFFDESKTHPLAINDSMISVKPVKAASRSGLVYAKMSAQTSGNLGNTEYRRDAERQSPFVNGASPDSWQTHI